MTEAEEIREPTRKSNEATPPRRYVYLAGPVELEDTWRERAAKSLAKMGLEPVDPLRGQAHKTVANQTSKHIKASVPDSLLVMRDLNDMQRIKNSAGFVLMNLSTTAEGRKPIGTLFELNWCWTNRVPVIAVMGRDCDPSYKHHPWIKEMVSYEATSVTDALNLIEDYFV
jgi:nucleoside 2-deoxyribosyltransferase